MGDINIILDGQTFSVPEERARAILASDPTARIETDADRNTRVVEGALEENYGGPAGAINAAALGAARAITLGGTDVAARAVGAEHDIRAVQKQNPIASTVGEIGGTVGAAVLSGGASLAARTPAALATRIGTGIAHTGEGAGVLGRVGMAAVGGAVEGGLQGAGQGISELALSDKPLTSEQIASTMSSRMLFGAGVGGAAGSVAKLAEIGLTKAKGVIEEATARRAALPPGVADDLSALDAKGLRAAKEAEVTSFKTAHAQEIETIEAQRVVQRKELADDLVSFRRETKGQNQFLTTKDVDLPASGELLGAKELGRKAVKANKALDNLFDDPIGLAQKPEVALKALRVQEDAYAKLLERGDDLRAAYLKEGGGGSRAAALDTVQSSLEKNQALQARIQSLTEKPTSPRLVELSDRNAARLTAIEDAKDALAMAAARPKSIGEQMAGGGAFSLVAGAASTIPLVGPLVAPFLGAKAASFVGEKVFGRMTKAVGEVQQRTAKAALAFVDGARKVTPYAPVVATKVLSRVRFAPGDDQEEPKGSHRDRLPALFKARTDEIRSQVTTGPDGKPMMRPEARQTVADQLSPIRALAPKLADQIETVAARRIEFLDSKRPRRPDVAGMPIGPDRWQPSEMEMRKWARYVAAVEDPGGIEERLIDGTVTPEDAEVMRKVYPERMAEITRQIVEQLPTLRATLPYERRLALSIFSGVPVDAAMDPRILSVLQASFTGEPGTEGGSKAPRATPQFGSPRSADKATPAQQRAQGGSQ